MNKAKDVCNNAVEETTNHFSDVRKMVSIGSASEKDIDDIGFTTNAYYLSAENGDSRKQQYLLLKPISQHRQEGSN